jgi:hypothetical protein
MSHHRSSILQVFATAKITEEFQKHFIEKRSNNIWDITQLFLALWMESSDLHGECYVETAVMGLLQKHQIIHATHQ